MKTKHLFTMMVTMLLAISTLASFAKADIPNQRPDQGPGRFDQQGRWPQQGNDDHGDHGGWGHDDHGGWHDGDQGPHGPQAQWIPVYRFFAGTNHFQTLDANEGINAGMRSEGISFSVLATPLPGTVGLYRCIVLGTPDHFISTDVACEGQKTEGIYGYIFQTANANANQPIYRCEGNGDHLSTLNASECGAAGYHVEGVQGFTIAQ